MKRKLENLVIFFQNEMIKFFNERPERSGVLTHVLKFLIKPVSHNYKILNV